MVWPFDALGAVDIPSQLLGENWTNENLVLNTCQLRHESKCQVKIYIHTCTSSAVTLQPVAAVVYFPTMIFLSLALGEQYDETQDWTKLLTTGILAVQPGILQRNLQGLDETEEFLFVFFSSWNPAPVAYFLFTIRFKLTGGKDKQTTILCTGFIDMDVNDSQSDTYMEQSFEVGEIIISVSQVKCAVSLAPLVCLKGSEKGCASLYYNN